MVKSEKRVRGPIELWRLRIAVQHWWNAAAADARVASTCFLMERRGRGSNAHVRCVA
jgi:hypothetical protein